MVYYSFCETPLGRILLAQEEKGLILAQFDASPPERWQQEEAPLLVQAKEQLSEYFAGTRQEFALPLFPKGTPFQQKVWTALQTIPWGQTRSYGEIARQIGSPKAARAVGMANHHNPIAILIPCHRVVGQNGALTGYAGGLWRKKALLQLEGCHLCKNQ